MRENTPLASGILRKAAEDLHAAQCLAAAEGCSTWTVGFHVQEVEKSLKSVLAFSGIAYPFTHDLMALVRLVKEAGITPPPRSEELGFLTPFGTLFRYDDKEWGAPPEEAQAFLIDMGAGDCCLGESLDLRLWSMTFTQ